MQTGRRDDPDMDFKFNPVQYLDQGLLEAIDINERREINSQKFSQSIEKLEFADKDTKVIIVRNLSHQITCQHLLNLFGVYGNIQHVKIMFKKWENGLIEYSDPTMANLARRFLNYIPLFGRLLTVDISNANCITPTNFQNVYNLDSNQIKYQRFREPESKNSLNITVIYIYIYIY